MFTSGPEPNPDEVVGQVFQDFGTSVSNGLGSGDLGSDETTGENREVEYFASVPCLY